MGEGKIWEYTIKVGNNLEDWNRTNFNYAMIVSHIPDDDFMENGKI